MRKESLKKTLITNTYLALIIAFVYFSAFMSNGLYQGSPVLKGNSGGDNVAFQIAVDELSDVDTYMSVLEDFGAAGTFFFSEQSYNSNEEVLLEVSDRGHGIGYYIGEEDDGMQLSLYMGGGYSIPVMNYIEGSQVRQVCPSLDVTKLMISDDWQQTLGEAVTGDMFIYLDADNNFEDFEKIVQIVLDKGYTILKVNEML